MWDEVVPDCFRRRYESFDLNIGAVRGADGLLLIDTRCHAVEARELLDDLRVLGPQPVRRIVNTHWHFDHCWGNATIRAASPGAEIYGHERLARWARNFFVEEKESVKQRWPELPVMMVTAYGDDERRQRATTYGAAEFISKPVDFEFLKQRLQRLPGSPD